MDKNGKKADELRKGLVCVNCMKVATSLYTSYSRDVIRITECKFCGKPVDKYVEYDIVLVFIDLILQYSTAYRHLLINVNFRQFDRLATIFLLCDAYEKWIERRSAELSDMKQIYHIEYQFYESLIQSFVEMFSYTISIYSLLWAFGVVKEAKCGRHKRLIFSFADATLMGFYGNIFVVFSIVWKLHQHWSYRFLTQLFLLISHIQVQRTLLPSIHWSYNCMVACYGIAFQRCSGYLIKYAFQSFS